MIIEFCKRGENDAPDFIKSIEVKGKTDDEKGFMRLMDLNIYETAKELLPGRRIDSTGLKSFASCGDFWSNFMRREGVAKNLRSMNGLYEMTIAHKADILGETEIVWPGNWIVADGEETDLEIGVMVYDPGYIITSSAVCTNIIGAKEPAYFQKITSKNFKQTSSRYAAKLFKDEKALLKYLKEKKHIFSFVHETGRQNPVFDFVPASSLWGHTPKEDVVSEIKEILDEINGSEDMLSTEPVKRAFGEDAKEEAILRMRDLDLYKPVVSDFKNGGKLYMSEFGGVIYDLNEEAKEAVRRTSEYGLPYHVVRSNHPEIGDMYAVLFVSNYKEDWDNDIFNPKDPYVFANVYNSSMGIDKMGTIGVELANGGLVRTA